MFPACSESPLSPLPSARRCTPPPPRPAALCLTHRPRLLLREACRVQLKPRASPLSLGAQLPQPRHSPLRCGNCRTHKGPWLLGRGRGKISLLRFHGQPGPSFKKPNPTGITVFSLMGVYEWPSMQKGHLFALKLGTPSCL